MNFFKKNTTVIVYLLNLLEKEEGSFPTLQQASNHVVRPQEPMWSSYSASTLALYFVHVILRVNMHGSSPKNFSRASNNEVSSNEVAGQWNTLLDLYVNHCVGHLQLLLLHFYLFV